VVTRRSWAVPLVITGFLTPLALAPAAVATAPESSAWPDTDNPPLAQALLVVVGIPILLFAVIFLLSYLPSMIRRQRGTSVEKWREEPEWFGGPRKGTAAVETPVGAATPSEPDATETGGASARW
jgi:hypothetical protein